MGPFEMDPLPGSEPYDNIRPLHISVKHDGQTLLSTLLDAFPQIAPLNIMSLHSPDSAILSAVIFNAVIIVALIPLALRGVKFRALSAESLLMRNLVVYGLGGVIVPFIGIKAIDIVITTLHLA